MKKRELPVWKVLYDNPNTRKIEFVNIFEFGQFKPILTGLEKLVKKSVKEHGGMTDEVREEFNKELDSNLMYYFWSKCEYEVIVSEWPPARDPSKAVDRKVDIYSQLHENFGHFSEVVWNYIK